jgi:hypothetical protein
VGLKYRFLKRKLTESTSMVHSPVDMGELYRDSLRLGDNSTRYSSVDGGEDDTSNGAWEGQGREEGRRERVKNGNLHNARYPKAKDVLTMDCRVDKGDAIWVPSYWWHEVQSYPSSNISNGGDVSSARTSGLNSRQNYPLNIAVNFWFAPLYEKEFPCATCKKDLLNQKYAEILKHLVEVGLLS